ncbi:MAG: Gldg family protein [Candidatus Aminicenantes bacterium]|nr:MAG: Gldg family protein [Candidatus Aminicenantes bacterium]
MSETNNTNNTENHKASSPLQKYYKFLLYLVVVILINWVGIYLFFYADLTSSNLYSLSRASKEVVSTLEEPLTINVFFTKNLPAPYSIIEQYLRDLLAEYERYSHKNLNYRFYDVTAQEGDLSEEAEKNRKIAQGYGIHPVNVQAVEQDQLKVQRAYMGMVLIHGDVIEKIPAIDRTEGLEYKITNAIQKLNNKISALINLSEKIKITLVLSSSLDQITPLGHARGWDMVESNLKEVVKRLNQKTYDQLELVRIDPSHGESPPDFFDRDRLELKWGDIIIPNGPVISAGKGMAAIGMSYGNKSLQRNLLNQNMIFTSRGPEPQYVLVDMKLIETFINENIDNMIDINEDLGYLKSNGAMPLTALPPQYPPPPGWQQPEALRRFNDLLSREYTLKEITLDDPIPESIDTLIIAGVKENFSDWQLFQVDQFLMKGKSLALFIDSFNEIVPQRQRGFQQPVYLPLNTGLEKLLDHYGLKVKKSYLLDENCFINRGRNREEMPIYFAPIIKNEKINHSLAFLENITQLVMIKASPLEADKEKLKKNKLDLKQLFTSSDKSWEMSGRINLMPFMIQPPPDDKKESKPLAYLLEGEFPSYFAGKPIPEKPKKEEDQDKEEEGNGDDKDKEAKPDEKKTVVTDSKVKLKEAIITKGQPGKIFLIGTSEILKDNALDEAGASPNAMFLLNTLDYLNNQEDIAVMRSKVQRFNPLKETKPFTRYFVKWANTLGLPALFVVVGILIWINRTNRKKRIQAMFGKNNPK